MNKQLNNKTIPWVHPIAVAWQKRVKHDRLPHAVMLLGPAGTGKRATASWMVQQRLLPRSAPNMPEFPYQQPEHPDLHWISVPEDKQSIGVDQVRQLVGELSLTAYEGGGKAAVIEPANLMTVSAANGLLKTLEEPPGDTLLILVADKVGYLPATIFSRCQRINFNRPDSASTLQWLDRYKPGADWVPALQAASGSPLAAIDALERLPDTKAMAADFAALAEHRVNPIEVAGRWAKHQPPFVLDWLCAQVQNLIRQDTATLPPGVNPVIPDSVLRRIDRRNLFCYLDIINRLRGQSAGSFNVQLTFESLLIDWAEGLAEVSLPATIKDARLSFLTG